MDTKLKTYLELNRLDLEQSRNEYLFALPEGISKWAILNILKGKEEKNIFIFYVMSSVLLTTVPWAISLYILEGKVSDLLMSILGLLYVIFNLFFQARSFILALHYSTHVSIFNRKFNFLKHINTSILCNFFGMPLWDYYAHHIAMHHCENNMMPHDVSSTMPYQRDSKLEHLKYMLRYVFLIWFELPYHLVQQKRYKVAIRSLVGSAVFFASIYYLFQWRPIATLFVFILPTIILSFALMEGNWKQHIFVDPDDPTNNYKSAYACINTPTNALNFNDGYHIEHHENPGMPWYRLPEYFHRQIAHYAEQDGFIFTNIGSGQVGKLVLNGQLDRLADHYLNVGQKVRTKEELIEEFKRRLQPIPSVPKTK